MRLAGRVTKQGSWWAAEVPMLGLHTQGRSRGDALEMTADAIRELVGRRGFRVRIHAGKGPDFEVSASDAAALTALLLKRLRHRSGLTLAALAERMDARSLNAWARYEQGRAVPTIAKLSQLFAAVSPGHDFVISESRGDS